MSILFYDHLVVIEGLRRDIDGLVESYEEREEIWQLVDELIHRRLMALILENLHERYHREFLENFHQAPYDKSNMTYLIEKITGIEELLDQEVANIFEEIKILLLAEGGPQEI